jgi:hypothetical protein
MNVLRRLSSTFRADRIIFFLINGLIYQKGDGETIMVHSRRAPAPWMRMARPFGSREWNAVSSRTGTPVAKAQHRFLSRSFSGRIFFDSHFARSHNASRFPSKRFFSQEVFMSRHDQEGVRNTR